VINTFLELGKKPGKTTEELKRMGTVIYKNFIPRDFVQQFVYHYLVLETEDVQIPWELMYYNEFFALKYAISRRIKSEKVLALPKPKKKQKKALIIADPTDTLPDAVRECEYLTECLQGYFTVTYLRPEKTRKVDVMYHFSQGYDIIHYAGELGENTCLPLYNDVLTCEEIERTLEGSPVVFLNGCGSAKTFSYDIEGLAKVFLERGALSFIGSLWGIHDKTAAEFAAEFYRNCLDHPVGEALRLSRAKYYSFGDIIWAAFVMYGDPTLNLYR
jgi:CHAT domain-containing protein